MAWYETQLGKSLMSARPVRKRSFSAAQSNRLTSSWSTSQTHVNRDIRQGLRALRARSRDLALNNEYGRKFLRMVRTNVVGPAGFSLQVHALRPDGSIDQQDSTTLERAFADWSRPGNCDVTGQLSFRDVCNLFIETAARDGEIAVRRVRRGPYRFQLELIDPTRIDVEYDADLRSGNKVRMGVEYDEFGAPVAYWLSQADVADPIHGDSLAGQRRRIPADELRLYFVHEQVRQLRGFPWMAPAMMRLNMLGGYEEAAVVAARVGAAKLAVIETEDGDVDSFAEDVDENDNPIIEAGDPGSFMQLRSGQKLSSWNPEYPHQQYGTFVKACLRGIAAGLGVSYNALANDLEGVNYSSIRAGVLEERDVWKALQGWMIDSFLVPLYAEWLTMALASGRVPLPMSKFDKFNAPVWQGRRWDWVDPEKDTQAHVLAVEKGLKSYSQVIREQGRDPDEVWRELDEDRKKLAAIGVPVTAPQGQA